MEEKQMGETMDIQGYLTAGVENIVKNAVKVTLKNLSSISSKLTIRTANTIRKIVKM
ncbi:MAG: hypothetical protein ACI4GE_08665 [Lachnospiraceae bacterium]|nr:hypothetical protein [Lachnospiraceae bacterium]MDY4770660.1 hypothetical protein [Lachnospiraceae bacterium]